MLLTLALVACGGNGNGDDATNGGGDADAGGTGAATTNDTNGDDNDAGGEQSNAGGNADANAGGTAAGDEPDPTTPLGSARLFVQSMGTGDFEAVAEIIDPASPLRQQLQQLGALLNQPADELTPQQRMGMQMARRMFVQPYQNAEVDLLDQDEDLAVARISFADSEGEVYTVIEDARLTRYEDLWLMMVTDEFLVADPGVQQEAREMSGGNDDGGDAADGGGEQADPPQGDDGAAGG
jgi:hypothetical protein